MIKLSYTWEAIQEERLPRALNYLSPQNSPFIIASKSQETLKYNALVHQPKKVIRIVKSIQCSLKVILYD